MSDHESDSSEAEFVVQVLKDDTLDAVAEYMKSTDCKNVYVMVGAGMSVAAGIPDFRSPKTGLYANLEALGLPYPEAVFQLSFFRENPKPFYTFAKDFDPSVFRPTLSHSFITLLHKKGLLRTCFTQNIDGLERRAHLPAESLVEAHGTITGQHCVECKREADAGAMWASIRKGEVFYCSECSHPVKPDIVFFGEALPQRFLDKIPELQEADLLLILGTSLTVHPFASLTRMVDASTPRVLFNLEEAGNIGAALNDVIVLDECDKGVRALCDRLGWTQELEEEWATTALPPKELDPEDSSRKPSGISGSDTAEDNVEKLAADLATTLNLDKPSEKEATKDKEVTADVSTSTNDEPLPTEPSQPKAQEEGKL